MLGNDQSKNWNTLNKLMGKNMEKISDFYYIDDRQEYDEKTIASKFCEHFVNHPKSIHENIPPASGDYTNLISRNPDSLYFRETSVPKVLSVINNMKNGGSIDDIPFLVLKLAGDEISKFIVELFNLCIAAGQYPENFKISRITPVFKKGLRENIENHRPISKSCNLSKIFDSLIYNRIQSFFIQFNLLSENQYGFRKGKIRKWLY